MLRHYKWHRKREESLAHGFMRYSASDGCRMNFVSCVHNLKQTHYHCLQVRRLLPLLYPIFTLTFSPDATKCTLARPMSKCTRTRTARQPILREKVFNDTRSVFTRVDLFVRELKWDGCRRRRTVNIPTVHSET